MNPRRPFLRPLLVWALAGPSMALAVLAGLLLSPFRGRRRAFWCIAPGWVRQVARAFGIRRRLEGWERLPEAIRSGRQPALFIANHASHFDPPLLVSTLPCPSVFMAKKELGRVPVLGIAIRMAGFILLDRQHGRRALASLQDAARRIREGQSVTAFPEGTRTRTGEVLPFKKGVFVLAREAGVAVVPMGILGGRAILPRGTWRVAPGRYTVRVGEPLDPGAFPDAETLREAARTAVLGLLEGQEPLQGRP